MRACAVLALGLGACLAPGAYECDGRLCPAGKVCAPNLPICIFGEQLDACVGKNESDACAFGASRGYCRAATCVAPFCGNRVVDPGELCDDGVNDGTRCSADCRSDLRCGNGVTDRREGCDCGDGTLTTLPAGCNGPNADDPQATCSTTCTLHGCGDGLVLAPEQCDPAAPAAVNNATCGDFGFYETTPLVCTAFCRYDTTPCHQRCGDHILNGTEICDGEVPPLRSCLDYGFDAGRVGCQATTCTPDLGNCRRIGWVREPGIAGTQTLLYGNRSDDLYLISAPNSSEIVVNHFDGAGWTVTPRNPTFPAMMWASGPDDVYVAGQSYFSGPDGVVVRWDGTAWSTLLSTPGQRLLSVWGSGRGDVFFGGEAGQLWHYDGSGVTPYAALPVAAITDIRGRNGGDVYAVASDGLLHFDGSGWSVLATPPLPLRSVGALFAGQLLFTAGTNLVWYDGVWTSTAMPPGINFPSVWAERPDNLFVADAAIAHFDGATWTTLNLPIVDKVSGLWGASGRDVWAMAAGVLFHYSGAEWLSEAASEQVPNPYANNAAQVVFAIGDDILVGGGSSFLGYLSRRHGGAWTTVTRGSTVHGIWASSAADVYLADGAGVSHGSGTSFASVLTGAYTAIWGSGPTDVFAVGYTAPLGGTATVQRWNGVAWTDTASPQPPIAVAGTGPTDVFAVGANGYIGHWNGSAWSVMTSGTTTTLRAVWAAAPDDVHAVGDGGVTLRYDGVSWRQLPTVVRYDLDAIAGVGASDIFASGRGGTILHWDGAAWTPMRAPLPERLVSIVARGTRTYLLSDTGTLLELLRPTLPWP